MGRLGKRRQVLKKLVDPDDILTPEEEKIVLRGEQQLRRGEYVTWKQLKHELGRKPRSKKHKLERGGEAISTHLRKSGVSEKRVLRDFKEWREARRVDGR